MAIGFECGLGFIKVGSEYYYTDCCGNFITGVNNTGTELSVSFNNNLANSGVGNLNTYVTPTCSTPTPTPTPTITPTNTVTPTVTPTNTTTPTPSITPSITPSNTPVTVLKNDCDVITLFDLGISCNVIQSPTDSDPSGGILSLNVTGGTAPYSFFWAGGQRSQTLFGVPAGTYEVVVRDYAWPDGNLDSGISDYTATTICVLSGPVPSLTPTTTPTPTPTSPVQCVDLCLIAIGPKGVPNFGPIQFVCDGTQNGRFKWSNGRYDIVWNPINNRWEIYIIDTNIPLTLGGGILASTTFDLIPDSAWVVLGGTEDYSVTMTRGNCPTVIPLQVSVDVTNSSCQGTTNCNGSVSMLAQDGYPPYYYSIDGGLTYSNNNTFTNLCPGTYTAIVTDSYNNSQNSSVTIDYDSLPTTYQLSLTNVGPATTTSVPNVSQTVTQAMTLVVTPPLPVGVSVTFNLLSTALLTVNGPGNGGSSITWDVRKNGQLVNTIVGPTTQVSQGTRPYCSPNIQIVNSIDYSSSITITNGDVINVTSTTIDNISNGQVATQTNCTTNIITQISAAISTPTIVGNNCSSVVGSSRQVQTNDFTYVPTQAPITPWGLNSIVCNYKSIPFTSIKGGTSMYTTPYVTSDGTKLYLPMYATKTINEYSFSIPNDITSTITYLGSSPVLPYYFSGLQFSSDGTKVFLYGGTYESVIREYSLSTPWNITTMSTTLISSLTYPTNASGGIPFVFNGDGTKIYAAYRPTSSTLYSVVWSLSVPYSLASAGLPVTSNITSTMSYSTGLMYVKNSTDEYYIPTGPGAPEIALFKNGTTNSQVVGTSNGCILWTPSCTDNVHIYDTVQITNNPTTWMLRQSLTGL